MMNYNKEEMNTRAFSFIYGYALKDAVLQKAFKGKKDWISEVSLAKAHIREYVDSILSGEFKADTAETKAAHEKAFLETAKRVCDAINENKPTDVEDIFSFGNAQKLINIVTKHFYAHTYTLNALSCENIRDNFRFCHCPMDSIMLAHVWKEYKEAFGNSRRAEDLGRDFRKSWGSEDFDIVDNERVVPKRYACYQKAIEKLRGNGISSIEYDYLIWKNDQIAEEDA